MYSKRFLQIVLSLVALATTVERVRTEVNLSDAPAIQAFGNSAADVRSKVEALDQIITDGTQKLDNLPRQADAQKTMAEVQSKIDALLAKLADSGDEQRIAEKILVDDRTELERINGRTYDEALKKRNREAIQKTIDETERVVQELTEKRHELTAQLKIVQNNQQFIEDSIRMGWAARKTEALRELVAKMQYSGLQRGTENEIANVPATAMATWNGEVRAAIYARKPSGVAGSATVSFIISAAGRVSSASSSGDGEMRGAALASVRGAAVPPPPDHRPHSFTIRMHD